MLWLLKAAAGELGKAELCERYRRWSLLAAEGVRWWIRYGWMLAVGAGREGVRVDAAVAEEVLCSSGSDSRVDAHV